MSAIVPAIDSTDSLWFDNEYGALALNAINPLSFDTSTHSIAISPASMSGGGYITRNAQSIGGSKTFAAVPYSLEAPTQALHLANKQYVDNKLVGTSWQDAVNGFHNFAGGDPSPLNVGDRYIAATTSGSFDEGNIYKCTSLTGPIWIEFVPSEGWSCYNKETDRTIIYSDDGHWTDFGVSINHQDLGGVPPASLTHTQINDFLDQSVKTTGSPTFDALTVTNDLTTKNVQANQYLRFKGMLNLTNQTGAHINQWIRIFKPSDPSGDCRGVLRLWTNRLSGNYSMEIGIQIGSKDYALSVINMSHNASSTTFAVKFGAFYNNTDKQMHVYYSASDNASNYSYSHARGPIPEIDMATTLRGPSDQLPTELVGKDITYTYQNSNVAVTNNFSPIGMSTNGELNINTIGNVVNFHNTETVNVLNPTDVTTPATGALVVSGGASIEKKLYVGDNIIGNGDATLSGALSCGGSIQTAATLTCDEIACGISGSSKQLVTVINEIGPPAVTKVNLSCDRLNVNDLTDATAVGMGALVVSGGASVGKNLYVGGDINGSGSATLSGSIQTAATLTCDELVAGISGDPKQVLTVINELGPPLTTKINLSCDEVNARGAIVCDANIYALNGFTTPANAVIGGLSCGQVIASGDISTQGALSCYNIRCGSLLTPDFITIIDGGSQTPPGPDKVNVTCNDLTCDNLTCSTFTPGPLGAINVLSLKTTASGPVITCEAPGSSAAATFATVSTTGSAPDPILTVVDITSRNVTASGTIEAPTLKAKNAGSHEVIYIQSIGIVFQDYSTAAAFGYSSGELNYTPQADGQHFRFKTAAFGTDPELSSRVFIDCAADSTSTTTGALTVAGGVGIDKRLTATSISCLTAPSASTDVVRKIDTAPYSSIDFLQTWGAPSPWSLAPNVGYWHITKFGQVVTIHVGQKLAVAQSGTGSASIYYMGQIPAEYRTPNMLKFPILISINQIVSIGTFTIYSDGSSRIHAGLNNEFFSYGSGEIGHLAFSVSWLA